MVDDSSAALAAHVGQLEAALDAGDPDVVALEGALDSLRQRFRAAPDLFDRDLVGRLKALAGRVRAVRREQQRAARAVQLSEDDLHRHLRDTFGYHEFRAGQKELIRDVLAGRDAVGIMPTGAGKSLTYQLPARVLGGVTLVVSPLIALMKDQVDGLTEVGFRATYLNSTLSGDERRERVAGLRRGAYEIVYAAPEGLQAAAGFALEQIRLSLIAVDEAHCISQWGHDFRPAYRNLADLKRRFGDVPVLALTATATPRVREDIVQQLNLQEPTVFRGTFFRPNLRVYALPKGKKDDGPRRPPVRESIRALCAARVGQSGIIYCLSRKATESIAGYLSDHGLRARAYHAGMDPGDREAVQNAFRDDDIDIVAATIAFGMGIDKSNVRYVIHRDMPRSIEGYYQEIGRAGRDGLESDCIMFYSWADVMAYDRITGDASDEQAARQSAQVREMFRMAESGSCRHQALAGYFGESLEVCGGPCDACSGDDPVGEALEATGGRRRAPKRRTSPATAGGVRDLDVDESLYDQLRQLRKSIADERGVPAYVVFNDATLLEMAARKPVSEAELGAITGVGPTKLERYGAAFLRAIAEA